MKVKTRKVRTVEDRVGYIARYIRQGLKQAGIHLAASMALTDYCGDDWCVQPRDWRGEVEAINDFIRNNVRYTLDPVNHDAYRTPERTLQLAMGDCDDMASLAGAMLMAVGIPVLIKVIRTRGQPEFHHIYIMAAIPPENPNKLLAVDPSQPVEVGWEPGNIEEAKLFEIT